MSTLRVGHCDGCGRLEPESALVEGKCFICKTTRDTSVAEKRQSIYLLAATIVALITTASLIICYIGS
jgi:hypothetical protein